MTARQGDRRPQALLVAASALALVILIAIAFWPALSAGFVSDDFLILQRLAEHGGLQHPAAYFGLRHFEYYRPLAFLSLAADWQFWARSAAGYHATALLLHAANTLFVFVLARRLMKPSAALAAAALFAVHPSGHEAAIWVSSRFDLMATAWLLLGLIVLRRTAWLADAMAALAFFAAVLSKESALALPVVAAAYIVLRQQASGRRLLVQLLLFAAAGAAYSFLRQGAGLPSMGGAARWPKLATLGVLVAALAVLARFGRTRVWQAIDARRGLVVAAAATGVAAIGLLAWFGPASAAVRGALMSVGFAFAHLLSPVSLDRLVGTLPPGMAAVGWAALALCVAAGALGWRRIGAAPDVVFLLVFLVAALVPVSSMTEGTRYLYLATVPAAMLAGMALDALSGHRFTAAAAAIVILLAVNTWQVRAKAADWCWASDMTAASADLIATSIGPRCADRDVVLLTAPVRVRGVYSNLNLESLAWLRDCAPASLRTVVRLGVTDAAIDARWAGRDAVEFTARHYGGGFVTSRDWRSFDTRLSPDAPTRIPAPLGVFDAAAAGPDLAMRLTFDDAAAAARISWFFYSDGAVRALPALAAVR